MRHFILYISYLVLYIVHKFSIDLLVRYSHICFIKDYFICTLVGVLQRNRMNKTYAFIWCWCSRLYIKFFLRGNSSLDSGERAVPGPAFVGWNPWKTGGMFLVRWKTERQGLMLCVLVQTDSLRIRRPENSVPAQTVMEKEYFLWLILSVDQVLPANSWEGTVNGFKFKFQKHPCYTSRDSV